MKSNYVVLRSENEAEERNRSIRVDLEKMIFLLSITSPPCDWNTEKWLGDWHWGKKLLLKAQILPASSDVSSKRMAWHALPWAVKRLIKARSKLELRIDFLFTTPSPHSIVASHSHLPLRHSNEKTLFLLSNRSEDLFMPSGEKTLANPLDSLTWSLRVISFESTTRRTYWLFNVKNMIHSGKLMRRKTYLKHDLCTTL